MIVQGSLLVPSVQWESRTRPHTPSTSTSTLNATATVYVAHSLKRGQWSSQTSSFPFDLIFTVCTVGDGRDMTVLLPASFGKGLAPSSATILFAFFHISFRNSGILNSLKSPITSQSLAALVPLADPSPRQSGLITNTSPFFCLWAVVILDHCMEGTWRWSHLDDHWNGRFCNTASCLSRFVSSTKFL